MADHRHDIEKYLRGELTSAEMHALEKKALDDPFLAEALEGAEQVSASDFSEDIYELNKNITAQKKSAWMWPARIAAGMAIIAISSFIVWFIVQPEPIRELALEKNIPTKEEELSTTTDTIATEPDAPLSSRTGEAASKPLKQKTPRSRAAVPLKNTKPSNEGQPASKPIADLSKHEELNADKTKASEVIAENKQAEKEGDHVSTEDSEQKLFPKTESAKKKDLSRQAAPGYDKRSSGMTSSLAPTVVHGKVTSAEDGFPLPGTNVNIKGSTVATITDEEGNYQLEIINPDQTLVFTFIGFITTESKIDNKKEMNVQLNADLSQLSEVVVTGYGTSNQESLSTTIKPAVPEGGTRTFKQYLENNVRYPQEAQEKKIEGRVTVEFTIEADGTLSNFKILRSLGSGCDEELIRLIKEGPKWIPAKKNTIAQPDKASVRFKFELPK